MKNGQTGLSGTNAAWRVVAQYSHATDYVPTHRLHMEARTVTVVLTRLGFVEWSSVQVNHISFSHIGYRILVHTTKEELVMDVSCIHSNIWNSLLIWGSRYTPVSTRAAIRAFPPLARSLLFNCKLNLPILSNLGECSGRIPNHYYSSCCSNVTKCARGHGMCYTDDQCQVGLKCFPRCPINLPGFKAVSKCCHDNLPYADYAGDSSVI